MVMWVSAVVMWDDGGFSGDLGVVVMWGAEGMWGDV